MAIAPERVRDELLHALSALDIDVSSLNAPRVAPNPITAVPTYVNKEIPMGTANLTDVRPAAASSKVGKLTIPRPLRRTFTSALVESIGRDDEQAADEVFMRLRHADTLKAHNRKRLQKAMDEFLARVPEWVDPVTIARLEAEEAKAEAEREAAEVKAEQAEAAPESRPEAAEPQSQAWAQTIAELTAAVAALTAKVEALS